MSVSLQTVESGAAAVETTSRRVGTRQVAIYQSPWRAITKPTGVGQHVAHMTRHLAESADVSCRLLATREDYRQARRYLPGGSADLPVQFLPHSERLLRAALLAGAIDIDRWTGGVDWVYCPKEQPVSTKHARLAVTVHDVLELESCVNDLGRKAHTWKALRWQFLIRSVLRRADLIATVSEFTRERIIELFAPTDDTRVVVVGNGVAPCYFSPRQTDDAEGLAGYGLSSEGYLVTVGSLTFRKGGDRLLDIAEWTHRNRLPWKIVITGRRHDAELLQRLQAMRRRHHDLPLSLLGYVSDDEQSLLLRNASALLFPSRYEGFGIPVLEAMAAGCPVICSRAGALPEVAGDAAWFAEATEGVEPWIDLISKLSGASHTRDRLVQRGRERARRYTWNACASKLVDAMAARS